MKKFFCSSFVFLFFSGAMLGIEKTDPVVTRILSLFAENREVVEDEISHRSRLGPPNEKDPLIIRLRKEKEDAENYLREVEIILRESQKEVQNKAAK